MPRLTRTLIGALAALLIFLLNGVALASQGATGTTTPGCSASPARRDLDFWIGEWNVTAKGQIVGKNTIKSDLAECALFETYTDPSGYAGKSVTFYDPFLKQWRQTWIDAQGDVSEFTGRFAGGALNLVGETHRGDRRILRRMTLTSRSKDSVHHFSEASVDGGKTWTTAYDFIYVRVK